MLGEEKKVVAVLGSGRSGSSLLMQALQAMGLPLSDELIPASVDNPDGYFEDAEVVNLHKRFGEQFGVQPYTPVDSTIDRELVRAMRPEITQLVNRRFAGGSNIWAVKDPRMVYYLAAWESVFRKNKIVPLYILAIRHPEAALRSLMTSSGPGFSASGAELVWLIRVYNALERTAGNCFIVHYEDWFSNPHELIRELASFTGIEPLNTERIEEIASGMVKDHLNRAIHKKYQTKNKHVLALYERLRTCRYMGWDRAPVMDAIADLREGIEAFAFWSQQNRNLYISSKRVADRYRETQEKLTAVMKLRDEFEEKYLADKEKFSDLLAAQAALEKKNEVLVREQKEVSMHNTNLSLAKEELVKRVGVLEEEQSRLASEQDKLAALTASHDELREHYLADKAKLSDLLTTQAALAKKNAALVREHKELSMHNSNLFQINEELTKRIVVLEEEQARLVTDNEKLVLLENAHCQRILALEDTRDSLLKQLQAEKALNAQSKMPPQNAKQAKPNPSAAKNPVKPVTNSPAKPAQPQKENKPQPLAPAKGGFPNLPQRMVLVFYQPFLRMFLAEDAWQRYLKKRSRFFARSQATPNRILRFFLKGLGPAPKDENPA